MKFYKTEQESKDNYKKHGGPIEETNNGFLHFDSDEEFLNWLNEVEPLPHTLEAKVV